jgi:enterochelin esterase-like enzyme
MKSLFHSLATAVLAVVVGLALLSTLSPRSASRASAVTAPVVYAAPLASEAPHVGPAAPHAALSAARTETRMIWSEALQRSLPYLAHLPAGYDSNPNARYPVLYMLHGRGGSYRSWQDLGLLTIADRLVESGEIQPFIIIMPEGENAYWVNHAKGGPRWGDYIGSDLVRETDRHFRTLADRDYRAVGGLSMGGCGALQLGINYADTFGVIGAHSPAFRTHETAPSYFGDLAYFNAHSPVPLFKTKPRVAKTLKIWIDMGQQDVWHEPALAFHQQLLKEGIPHQWQGRPGGHDGAYWTGHAAEYLRYYDRAFRDPVAWLDPRSFIPLTQVE